MRLLLRQLYALSQCLLPCSLLGALPLVCFNLGFDGGLNFSIFELVYKEKRAVLSQQKKTSDKERGGGLGFMDTFLPLCGLLHSFFGFQVFFDGAHVLQLKRGFNCYGEKDEVSPTLAALRLSASFALFSSTSWFCFIARFCAIFSRRSASFCFFSSSVSGLIYPP